MAHLLNTHSAVKLNTNYSTLVPGKLTYIHLILHVNYSANGLVILATGWAHGAKPLTK